jgi:endonuclease III-like uncharacterized protein
MQVTREQAIEKAVKKMQEDNVAMYTAVAKSMSDEELEDFIDEHFYNYSITL